MKLFFFKVFILLLISSCSNINFLVGEKSGSNLLKNKTAIYIDGWDKPVLKEVLFLRFGKVIDKKFILTARVDEKQTKRAVSENQVAQKIDYKIKVDYLLSDVTKKCPSIEKQQTSSFSFTPKSSGYNFASDVLLQNLFEEAILSNVNTFISFANSRLKTYSCLDEN